MTWQKRDSTFAKGYTYHGQQGDWFYRIEKVKREYVLTASRDAVHWHEVGRARKLYEVQALV